MTYLLAAMNLVLLVFASMLTDSGSTLGATNSLAVGNQCEPGWTVVSSLNPGQSNSLSDVAAVSADDIWAVGMFNTNVTDAEQRALAQHWDGTAWSVVPTPVPGSAFDYLNGVAAVAVNDVWAVGSSAPIGGTGNVPLMMHWDGSAWTLVAGSGDLSNGQLYGVDSVSFNDVWAVGSHLADALIMHWNGAAWSVVPGPPLDSSVGSASLTSVAALSSNDVWAVGDSRAADDPNKVSPLIMHWNGTAWTVVPSPSPPGNSDLRGVAAVSANDVWAVGQSEPGGTALIMHWDGIAWSIEQTPATTGTGLMDVAAFSADDVWATGAFATWHWDGATWSVVNSMPYGQAVTTVVNGLDRDVWVVGYTQHPEADITSRTLTARFCGHVVAESPSPTPAPLPTPAGLPQTGGYSVASGSRDLEQFAVLGLIASGAAILAEWSRTRRFD